MQNDQTTVVSVDLQHDDESESETESVIKPQKISLNPAVAGITSDNNNNNNNNNIKGKTINNEGNLRLKLNQIPKCKLPPASEMAAIETFVANAVQSQEPRNDDDDTRRRNPSHSTHADAYRAILNALKRPNENPNLIWKVLLALRTAGHGSILNLLALKDNHAQLLHLVIRFVSTVPPINTLLEETAATGNNLDEKLQVYKDYSLCDAHFNLLLAIVSAKSTHVVPILTAIWKLLTSYGPIGDEGVTNRIHVMICNILRIVPRSNADLYPIIASKFPFWLKDKEILVWYTTQSFKVLEYLPTIRQGLFELLIDKCVEIDVNIFIKDNGDAIVDDDITTTKQTNGDDKEAEENQPIVVSREEKSKLMTSVDVLSDKLDALLELLFEQIQFGCKNYAGGTQQIYYELLPIFESTILTTHKSKFVQFCMFIPCGLEVQIGKDNTFVQEDDLSNESKESPITILPEKSNRDGTDTDDETILYREFVSKLLQIIVDPYRAATTRQSSACYLASFVSRASFVCVDTVCESISALLRWAEAYIGSLPPHAVRASDARQQSDHHSIFYTVCQAAFYIMSFRGNEAIEYYREAVSNKEETEKGIPNCDSNETSEDLEYMNLESKRWSFLCGHPLQPLRFCLESVRSEFLHVAHFYGLIDEDILNKLVADAKRLSTGRVNKKAASSISTAATLERRRQTGGVGGLGRGSNPLKSFFPFDPLLLRQSHEFIEPLYKYWQGPVEEEDVLVIDEIERDGDPTFDTDESIEESDGESGDDDDDEENDDDDDDSDALSETDSFVEPNDTLTPDAYRIKLLQKKAWTETTKRPRSQSLENGSW